MKSLRKSVRSILLRNNIQSLAFFLVPLLFTGFWVQAQKTEFIINQQNNPLRHFSVPVNKESHPFFVDIDGDGDLDCFSGEYAGNGIAKIYLYRNNGTDKIPNFKLADEADNPLIRVEANRLSIPYFIDIDNDGDFDCFIGEGGTGALLYFKNVGSKQHPVLVKQSAAFNPLTMVKYYTSSIANPTFGDLDGDGDNDCIITDEAGEANLFTNIGSASEPLFQFVSKNDGLFQSFPNNKSIYNLFLSDWNKDGLVDLIINTTCYKNMGTQRNPHFDFSNGFETGFTNESTYQFSYNPARCVDINGDGSYEIFQGKSDGSFEYQTVIFDKKEKPQENVILNIFPNPSKAEFILYQPTNNQITVRILDEQGKLLKTQMINNTWKFGKDLIPGVYIVQLYQRDGIISSKKIIKQ